MGAGGAGLSAAIQARRVSDHSVLVLERNAMTGGSTALSGGGISVGGAEINKTAVFDFTGKEYADFFEGHTNSLDYLPEGITINRSLVEKIGNAAGPYFDYLTEQGLSYGPVLPMHGFGPEGRGVTGVTATPSAAEVWGTWYTELAEKHGAEIRTNSTVTELLSENGTVTGVKVETPDGIYNVKAKKVILATGGYARDMEMVAKNNAAWENVKDAWPYAAGGCVGSALTLTEPLDGAFTGYGMLADLASNPPWSCISEHGNEVVNSILCYVDPNGDAFTDPAMCSIAGPMT